MVFFLDNGVARMASGVGRARGGWLGRCDCVAENLACVLENGARG